MNYIKHLTGFFEKVAHDRLLNATHVSLYMALFQFWNCNRFRNPISISREEVMRISKISAKATYHKCLKALHAQGYIKYEPSYNPFRGSHVYMFSFSEDLKPFTKMEKDTSSNFEPVGEQVAGKLRTIIRTGLEQVAEQVVVPFINNTNITNNLNLENSLKEKDFRQEHKKKITHSDIDHKPEQEKSFPKKEQTQKLFALAGSKILNVEFPPTKQEVLTYFEKQDFPELEASKFFNYFTSVGWLVGGKTQMTDWTAAAQNWILNAYKYSNNGRTDRTKNLDTSAGKTYSEPL